MVYSLLSQKHTHTHIGHIQPYIWGEPHKGKPKTYYYESKYSYQTRQLEKIEGPFDRRDFKEQDKATSIVMCLIYK